MLAGAVVLASDPLLISSPARAEGGAIVVAQAVPLPRPNPARPGDPIGALISGKAAPVPIPKPAPVINTEAQAQAASAVAPPASVSADRSIIAEAAFKVAVRLFDEGDATAALVAAYALPDPVDAKVIKWLLAVYRSKELSASRLDTISKELADWPGQRILRIRFEQALAREKPTPSEIIEAFGGNKPESDDGTLLLARAYVAAGRKAEAAALIRPRWREERLEDSFEESIRKEFGGLLTTADHKARMDRMLYAELSTKALRAASTLDSNQQALAKAAIAVMKRDAKADTLLDDVPKSLQKDPVYIYSRIQELRRDEKIDSAAKLMVAAPRDPAVLGDRDAWWVERRVLAREVMKKRDYATAYRIVAGHAAETGSLRAEAEFHAGWLALEFLRDPATAARHFAGIQASSRMPLSRSRAVYWLGRAAEAAGNRAEAQRQYRLAAAYSTTFYGQLALARLGAKTLPLSAPKADAAARKGFARLELVQVMLRLAEVKRDDRKAIFMRHLADTLTDPTHVALLTAMGEKDGDHPLSLQLAKMAAYRNVPVDTLAFPISAIPKSAKTDPIDRAIVYAIARQESSFHPGAISRAGARGLLQLMPATAKQMAKRAGVSYSRDRLTSDPAYNAALGARFLDQLIDRFNGSYVMAFAAYNAGPSRVLEWVKTYGDPRDPGVDVINWIELIPFTETRNYVQRIMENVQVYRARLGSPALTIERDLKRGDGRQAG